MLDVGKQYYFVESVAGFELVAVDLHYSADLTEYFDFVGMSD